MTESAHTWVPTFERWDRNVWRGVITRPWPADSGRYGQQRIVCPHKAHKSPYLAHKCAAQMVADRD